MANIRSDYRLMAAAPCNYELTGSNRNATFDINVDQVLNLFVLANDVIISPIKGFLNYENYFRIKRARIYASGGEGVRPALNSLAARINFSVVAGLNGKKLDNTAGDVLASFALYFEKWDEWENFDIKVEPFKTDVNWDEYQHEPDKKPCSLIMLEHAQFFSVDDYNIQSPYIGQTIYPYIHFEIDTAGIILENGDII